MPQQTLPVLLLCVNLEPMLCFHLSNSNARTIIADEPHQAVAAALPSSLPHLLLAFCHLLHRQAAFVRTLCSVCLSFPSERVYPDPLSLCG